MLMAIYSGREKSKALKLFQPGNQFSKSIIPKSFSPCNLTTTPLVLSAEPVLRKKF